MLFPTTDRAGLIAMREDIDKALTGTAKPLRYEYLVSYYFAGGNGRAFVTRDSPIQSGGDIEGIEKSITASNGKSNVGINGFQLLRTYESAPNEQDKAE